MAASPLVPLGRTGLWTSRLGLGAGPLGDPSLPEQQVDRLLELALDLGLRLVDTAPSYGESERRIGRLLRRRRADLVLSTKLGYGVPGIPDWTGPCITAGVDRALAVLGVEVLDIAHLHSCPREVLARGEVVSALRRAVEAGKVRFAAYSGEGEALAYAISCGAFEVVQASCSLLDPGARELTRAREAGLGTIAKRPLANAVWREPQRPSSPDRAVYFDRWQALGLHKRLAELDLSVDEGMLRWAAWHPAVDTAIVGTTSPDRLRSNVQAVARGPLEPEVATLLTEALDRAGAFGWPGVV